jgi:BirA family transcriptional regulator, biotin operon repressor / biotin---[acetyl-CoA-carboxylase] ligase
VKDSYRQLAPSKDALTILHMLLASPHEFVSGRLLAEKIGMSRPAIHGKLDKLREQGFTFEAVRNRGYRLVGEPKVLHPDLLNYYAAQAGIDFDLLYFPVIDSTNSEAERQLASGRKGPFAVISSCQTKGRGRLGRIWHSASADNLYLTVAFEPNIPPQQLQHFTLWAGIHICRSLQRLVFNAPLKIKWPNDLQCEGRKFAGMLTEAKMDADSIRSILFGIGLNVNSNPSSYPSDIRKSATSLYAIHGRELPLSQIAAQVTAATEAAYQTSILAEISEDLCTAWAPLDSLSGKTVTVLISGKEITCVADGIDESGALLLRSPDGKVQRIRAGDVTLKK